MQKSGYIIFIILFFSKLLIGQQLFLNEIMSSNDTTIADFEGDYMDWIEVYNASDESIDLSGYGLSDDVDEPFKWTFPVYEILPYQFILVWASDKDLVTGDELHTNFKIKSAGEFILLTNTSGIIVDSVFSRQLATDISLGRKPDAGSDWFYFNYPSPGAANTNTGYQYLAPDPEFSVEGGFFSGTIHVEITTDGSLPVHYTTDGSEPTPGSTLFENSISVNTTTVIKARVFAEGYLINNTITNTYIDRDEVDAETLPIVSISTHPDNLFDDDVGLFMNAEDDLEKPVHVEFFEPDGTLGFSIDAGIKIFGNEPYSGVWQQSLSIFARRKYGYGSINYRIFPEKNIDEFEVFILRNPGFQLRDGLSSYIARSVGLDAQAFRTAVVFINGEYWGIQNVREKINEHFLAANQGVDPDNVDLINGIECQVDYYNYDWVMEGDLDQYVALIEYLLDNDI